MITHSRLHMLLAIILSLLFATEASAQWNQGPRTFPSLPGSYRENRVKEIETAFEERSKLFLQGRQFHAWKKDQTDENILNEFKILDDWRHHVWYSEATGERLISRPDFIVAQDLLEKGYYKRPHLIAFQYNQTDGSYNSSTIVLNNQRFLALEAPTTEKLTENFFKLLQNFQVTQLVRLTPAHEKEVPKSLPYWTGRMQKGSGKYEWILQAPFAGSRSTYPIHYYVVENWQDNRGIDPQILLETLEAVRRSYDPKAGLLACHCSGGVGRTGTFIAGFLLLQEIDRQIAQGITKDSLNLSIEKIVLQLSLQRIQMVSRADQYKTLYRLVDLYVKGLPG